MYCEPLCRHDSPHIYGVAHSAFASMTREGRNQCCVVSGESGAGKTEASNLLVQHLMRLGRAETKKLEEKILLVKIVCLRLALTHTEHIFRRIVKVPMGPIQSITVNSASFTFFKNVRYTVHVGRDRSEN